VFDAGRVPVALDDLPLGFYKDFGALSTASPGPLEYVPIVAWQARNDVFWKRALASAAFLGGRVPHPEGTALSDFRDQISLDRLQARIRSRPDRYPPGTLFLLGVEPGYRPNGDERTPAEIARDAGALRDALDALGRGYRLGLGGISTPRNDFTRAAYGGIHGLDFLERILAEARDLVFDAFVVHPYPSDPSAPDAADSARQIREARQLLARHGLRDRELLVGEVGAPFRAAREADLARYAREVVELMLTARDGEIGHPGDENRLVQRFAWMLLAPLHRAMPGLSDNPALDFRVSALFDERGERTAVGESFFAALRASCTPGDRWRGPAPGSRSRAP
jgi:hypothetical protein